MSIEVTPGKFMEINRGDGTVSILCNIGTIDKPYLEVRDFPIEPLEKMVEGFSEYPENKYCTMTTSKVHGGMSIAFDAVDIETNIEFYRNFIKPDNSIEEGEGSSFLEKEG